MKRKALARKLLIAFLAASMTFSAAAAAFADEVDPADPQAAVTSLDPSNTDPENTPQIRQIQLIQQTRIRQFQLTQQTRIRQFR